MSPASEYSGGCACGAVRYACSEPPLAMLTCHCRDCQRAGGGTGSPTVVVSRAGFALTRGEPKLHSLTAESGAVARRAFCGECGSPLWASSSARDEAIGLRAASLDDPSWFRPSAHVWTASAQPWDCMETDVPRFARNRRPGVEAPRLDHLGRLVDHVHLVVRDLAASRAFYAAVLGALGLAFTWQDEHAFACDELYVSDALGADASAPHRVHLALQAPDRAAVERFHAAALAAGGRDHGAPGERAYHPGYYAAFALDPDGNNVEAVHHGRGRRSAASVVIAIGGEA